MVWQLPARSRDTCPCETEKTPASEMDVTVTGDDTVGETPSAGIRRIELRSLGLKSRTNK